MICVRHCGGVLLVLLFAIVWGSSYAQAHTRSQSVSALSVDGDEVSVSFRVTAREVTRLGVLDPQAETLPALLATHLLKSLAVTRGDVYCPVSGAPRQRSAASADLRFEIAFTCDPQTIGQIVTFTNNAFFAVASRHIHFARAKGTDGAFEERLLTATQRSTAFSFSRQGVATPVEESAARTFVRYVSLGAEHIWIGIDHLAFLIALLLLCSRLRDVVFVVTGFTVGHSITLSLTVLGLAVPNPPVVEALIAFTIVLVAIEALVTPKGLSAGGILLGVVVLTTLGILSWMVGGAIPGSVWGGLALLVAGYAWLTRDATMGRRLLPTLTLVFGLIHGFGFAGVLLELGLPTDRLALALFSFNLGVEIGQLVFVAVLWVAAMVAAPRFGQAMRLNLHIAAAATLCVAGSYWFALRAFS